MDEPVSQAHIRNMARRADDLEALKPLLGPAPVGPKSEHKEQHRDIDHGIQITLMLADAFDVLPALDPVDVTITDPPYGPQVHQNALTLTSQGPVEHARKVLHLPACLKLTLKPRLKPTSRSRSGRALD
jgi:hypothetical protein